MRVIAGKYRGRKLKSPPSIQTRPTSDRLRETLFNILAPRIEGSRFLDLCAGTGAVGIEALSRGAARVVFVDRSRKTSALIAANVESLKGTETKIEIVAAEALESLRRHVKHQAEPFDIIFFDPPYAEEYEAVLGFISAHVAETLQADGIVIVEHHKKKQLSDEPPLKRYREVKQGDSVLSFFRVG